MIKEIVYLPTMRCNYSCKHCDQGRYNTKNEELSCKHIANIVKKSIVSKSLNVINIAGGEPFVKDDLEEFVLEIVNDATLNIHIFITTNGYFSEKVWRRKRPASH